MFTCRRCLGQKESCVLCIHEVFADLSCRSYMDIPTHFTFSDAYCFFFQIPFLSNLMCIFFVVKFAVLVKVLLLKF